MQFGCSVSVSPNGFYVAVGARGSDEVFLYEWNSDDFSYDVVQVITPGHSDFIEEFGCDVHVTNTHLYVASRSSDDPTSGCVRRYTNTIRGDIRMQS